MGHGMLPAHAGHVRGCIVDGIAPAAGAGARPDGHQAAVLLLRRRGRLFRLRAEGDTGASGHSQTARSARSQSLSFGQLRTGSAHFDRGDPESTAGAFAGMAARESVAGTVVEALFARAKQVDAGRGERGAGLESAMLAYR